MNSSELAFYLQPSRQSPVAILLILFKLGKTVLRSLWPVLLVYLVGNKRDFTTTLEFAVMGVALFVALGSIISYFRFYFYIQDDELIIQKGIFNRSRVNVPFNRIQTVNLQQNIIHQIFNVVSVEIDSAGSKGSEISINALSKEKAYQIREYLLSKKVAAPAAEQDRPESLEELYENEQLLLNLELKDLIKIGVTQNHLQNIGILTAFFFGLYDMFEDILGKAFAENVEGFFNFDNGFSFFTFLIKVVPFFLVLSFALSLVNTVLKYFDLRFFQSKRGFKLIGGLLNRQEQSATFEKIQVLRWSSNVLQKYFGMKTLRLLQAASTRVGRKKSINVPGCYDPQLHAVRFAYFPEEQELIFEKHKISRLIVWRRLLYLGILPAIGLILLIPLSMSFKLVIAPLWVIGIFATSYLYHKKWRYEISTQGLRTQRGIFGEANYLLKWYKIQSVKIRQGIYQRRKGLADIYFYTAAGSVTIPYIPLENAKALKDYSLYAVETNTKEWM